MIRKARMVSKTRAKVSTQLLNGRWRIERRFDRAWIAQLHWTNTTLEKENLDDKTCSFLFGCYFT